MAICNNGEKITAEEKQWISHLYKSHRSRNRMGELLDSPRNSSC